MRDGSLALLLLIRFVSGATESDAIWTLGTTLALANFINHPHFAHLYQIFYSDYSRKISADYPRDLRARYLLVDTVAPIALIACLALPALVHSPRSLGLMANAMLFLVGWHYVKQGYGMAMVDAVLKRAFYGDREKKGAAT